jgi:hypothetical protein
MIDRNASGGVMPDGKGHPWRVASMKITNEVLEAHLACKTKGRLKLAGEASVRSDYDLMTTETRQASRRSESRSTRRRMQVVLPHKGGPVNRRFLAINSCDILTSDVFQQLHVDPVVFPLRAEADSFSGPPQ